MREGECKVGVEENSQHCGGLSLLPLTKLTSREDNGTVVKEKERTGSETVRNDHVTYVSDSDCASGHCHVGRNFDKDQTVRLTVGDSLFLTRLWVKVRCFSAFQRTPLTVHLELPIASFISAALCLAPLPWHWRAGTIPTISIAIWLFVVNIVNRVNTIIWAGNFADMATIWCDISAFCFPIDTSYCF